MSVARVTELSATSETSFEDAINQAVARATKTLRGVQSAWVKDMNVSIENGNIKGYRVNLEPHCRLRPSVTAEPRPSGLGQWDGNV